MLVHKLCQQFCLDKISHDIHSKLGEGANGEVFLLKDPSKVIKLSAIFGTSQEVVDTFAYISSALDYIVSTQPRSYVRVYEYKYLGSYLRPMTNNNNQYVGLYYYISEHLNKISEDEKKVFHSILSHEDKNIIKKYSLLKIKKMLEGMQRGLDFNLEKIILFHTDIIQSPVNHHDIHARNIMKDHCGNFKLIDMDSCRLKEYKTCLKK